MALSKFASALVAWIAASGVLAAPATTMLPVTISNITELPDAGAFCAGLMKKSVCCKGELLGLVHTGCVAPFPQPTSAVEFIHQCNADGKVAQCCSLNVVRYFCLPCMLQPSADTSQAEQLSPLQGPAWRLVYGEANP